MRSFRPERPGAADPLSGELSGLRATIFGLGREGQDLARYLARHGALVTVTDNRPESALSPALAALQDLEISYVLGGHPLDRVLDADVVFASPGVPPELEALQTARSRGMAVSSATELLFARCPVPIVGITGSSGKTTTTALTGEMLAHGGRHVLTGGNIGIPLLNRLDELGPDSLVVLELSSFQLEFMTRSPSVAAITNLTPNHLDRHPSMEAYGAAKAQILNHQDPEDRAILNADDPGSRRFRPVGQQLLFSLEPRTADFSGAFLEGDELRLESPYGSGTICAAAEIRLRGRHNVANTLAATAIAAAAGASLGQIGEAIRGFRGVSHRLELVAEIDGVRYYNDSIATAPERSIAALNSFSEPIVLLAGGRDKHLEMAGWAELIRRRAHHVVLFGEMAGLVDSALRAAGQPASARVWAQGIEDAVTQAARVANRGDVVLLSPGGTSYDMFENFEHRGEAFAAAVRTLGGQR